MKSNNIRKTTSIVIGVLAIIVLLVWLLTMFTSSADNITEYEFYQMYENGDIRKVYVEGGYTVKVMLAKDSKVTDERNFPSRYDYSFNIANRITFGENIVRIREKVVTETDTSQYTEAELKEFNEKLEMMLDVDTDNPGAVTFWDVAYPILIILLFIFLAWFVISRMAQQNNQNINFGKSKARVNENVKVRFTDVAGAEEEKEELQEIIEFLKNPKKFGELGARIPHGVLLVGAPGTGKTLFAKAVAGEAGVPFFSISGSDFVEMFVGVGASRVRDLFEQAKKNMPCIVFIDEIDAVGRQRGAGLGGGHDEREQTLNQLLVEMDGFETNSGIIIMAATNRADILDPALMRPGRFDRQIYVHHPDVRGREAILKVHARNKPLEPEVDFQLVARITVGFTGADLENLLNEAAILAVRAERKRIALSDINEGITKVLMGPQKKSRLVTEYDRRITAYHEAGHAVLACKLKYCDPVHEVTIIPRGQAAGYTMTRPDSDDNHLSKAQLMDRITMGLGGRVAEELVMQNVCTGASGDIRDITVTAHSMVTEWGMSDVIGPVYYGADHEVFVGKNFQSQNSFSESMAAVIDAEANKIIKECHERATAVLKENISVLHSMARVLLEKETIHADEVNMLLEGKTADEVIKYIDKKYNPSAKETPKAAPKKDLFGDFPEVKPLDAPESPKDKN